MKTIRILENKQSGRVGGEVILNDDMAARYVAKKRAVYVERTEASEKPKGETKADIYAYLEENKEKLEVLEIELKGIQSYKVDELKEMKELLEAE